MASESSSIDPREEDGVEYVRAGSVAGRSGQLCLHWPCMFCRLGGRPLLDANCPFATTIISTSNRAGPARLDRPGRSPRCLS